MKKLIHSIVFKLSSIGWPSLGKDCQSFTTSMEGMPSANPSEGFESSIQAVGPLSLPWWSNIDFIKLSRLDLLINVRRAQHFSDKGLVRWQDTTGKPKTRRNVCFYKYIYCDSLFSLSWVPLPLLSHDIQIQHVRESMKKILCIHLGTE